MKRIAIIGSRDYPNKEAVERFIEELPGDTVVVTGGWWSGSGHHITPTRGVDRIAAMAARSCGLTVVVVAADYQRYQKRAGFRRNPAIIDCAEEVAAFWDGKSNGTRAGIEYARKSNKPGVIIKPEFYAPEKI